MAAANEQFKLYCCGSRGSRPVEGRRFNEFGGFTSCYVLKKGDYALIIDCGTGLYEANAIVLDCSVIDVILTHMHYDHILGLLDWTAIPKNARVTFYGGFREWFGDRSFEEFFRNPFWPVQPDFALVETPANHELLKLRKDLVVDFFPAPHPNESQLMIIKSYDSTGKEASIVVMFDNEESDSIDREYIRNCDYLLYDGMYTDAEYPSRKGFGHSTWQEGCRLATHVNCKRLIITHHDPDRTDEQLRKMEKLARDIYPATDFARSGMEWEFPFDPEKHEEVKPEPTGTRGYQKLKERAYHRFNEQFITNKDRMRFVSLGTYVLLGLVSLFMTFVNIATNQIALMYSTIVFAVLCGLNVVLDLIFRCNYKVIQTIFQVELFALLMFFIITGHPEGFSLVWALMLPVAGMFVFGKKRTTIISLILLGALIFLFYTTPGRGFLQYEYTSSFLLRFPMAFTAFLLLSFFLETVRENTFKELEALKEKQAEIIADQTSEIREQYFSMVRTNSKLQLSNNLLSQKIGKELTDDEIRELLGNREPENGE